MFVIKKELLDCTNKNFIEKIKAKNIIETNIINDISELWLMGDKVLNNSTVYPSGYFMNIVTKELYLIYLSSSNSKEFNFKVNNSNLKEEIEIFNKICFIVGIKPLEFLLKTNEDNKSRKFLKRKFLYLTKSDTFWDGLENKLDLFMFNKENKSERDTYLKNISIILKNAIDYLCISGQIDKKCYLEELKYIFLTQSFENPKVKSLK